MKVKRNNEYGRRKEGRRKKPTYNALYIASGDQSTPFVKGIILVIMRKVVC
jgi:hypothetical protein